MKNKQKRSETINFLILISGILLSFASCSKSELKVHEMVIERISSRWVPDQREGIANIIVSEGKDNTIVLKGETDCRKLKNEILDSLSAYGNRVIDSIIVLPGAEMGELRYGVVTLSVINLRIQPDHSAELVNQALMGTPVRLLKSKGSWLLVQTPDRYIAWTEKSSLQLMGDDEMDQWKYQPRVIYTENSGWIYKAIDSKEVIGDMVAGCILKSTGSSGSFEKVSLPDGREGYVRKGSVRDFTEWRNSADPEGKDIYQVASSLTGLPYIWGGSSSKAVDCSGFVQISFFMNGIILSRDASLQALHGLPLDISTGWSDLKIGDLLFFGTIKNSKPRVTHVAIYKGDSEYIHSAGRVMVNSLDSTRINFSSYRKNTLLSARRIICSVGSAGITAVKDQKWY